MAALGIAGITSTTDLEGEPPRGTRLSRRRTPTLILANTSVDPTLQSSERCLPVTRPTRVKSREPFRHRSFRVVSDGASRTLAFPRA